MLVCDGHIYDRNSITQWIAEGNKPFVSQVFVLGSCRAESSQDCTYYSSGDKQLLSAEAIALCR